MAGRAATPIWTRDDARALCGLVDSTLPGEQLSADDVVSACFDDPDPSIVLALPQGEGAIAAVIRTTGDRRTAHLMLLAVEPSAQGQGRGRRLLTAAEDWAFHTMAARAVVVGGCSPFGLWPGVDVRWTRSLCLFESAGYTPGDVAIVLSCPSTHRGLPPDGVDVHRVLQDDEADNAMSWAGRHLPGQEDAVRRALEHGCCLVATDASGIVGLVCHSINRAGWVGPIAVSPPLRRKGIGRALLASVCTDLRAAGWPDVHIATPVPLKFFVRSAGASVARVFRSYVLAAPDRAPAQET